VALWAVVALSPACKVRGQRLAGAHQLLEGVVGHQLGTHALAQRRGEGRRADRADQPDHGLHQRCTPVGASGMVGGGPGRAAAASRPTAASTSRASVVASIACQPVGIVIVG
jgi:hypothetical protein